MKAARAKSDDSIRLGAWMNQWLKDYAGRKCSPKTLERYYQLAKYLAPTILQTPLVELTTLALDQDGHAGRAVHR